MNQQTVTRDLAFLTLSKFLSMLQTKNHKVNRQIFYGAKAIMQLSNYVVKEFSAERQRAIVSWDHYLTT